MRVEVLAHLSSAPRIWLPLAASFVLQDFMLTPADNEDPGDTAVGLTGLNASAEVKALFSLAWPIMISMGLMMALNIEDQVIVGQLLQKEDLAACAIANVYFNLFWYFLNGLMSAVDTFCSQAYGAKKYTDVGLWAQRGLVVCLAICVPILVLWGTATEVIIRDVFQQDPSVAAQAAVFVRWLMPGLPAFVIADILRRWLQAQGILRPAVTSGLVVNLLNIGANFLFIHNFGFIGSPIATSLCRIAQVVVLVMIIRSRKLHLLGERNGDGKGQFLSDNVTAHSQCTWPRFSWSRVARWSEMKRFVAVAFPGAGGLLLEAGAFEMTTIIVGSMRNIDVLDAHFVMLSLCGFSFVVFPLAVSIAGSIRVGNCLGSNDPEKAKFAAWTNVGIGTCFMVINGIIFASARGSLGSIFTSSSAVVRAVAKVAPIAAAFQVVDGLQGTAAGALRGCGRQKYVLWTNLLGFWVMGLPIGAALAFAGDMGVYGVWWGLVAGLSVAAAVSIMLLTRINWHIEASLARQRLLGGGGNNLIDDMTLQFTELESNNDKDKRQYHVLSTGIKPPNT